MVPRAVTSVLMPRKMIASWWPSCLCLKCAIFLCSGCPHRECPSRWHPSQGCRLHQSWARRGCDLSPRLVLHHVSGPLPLEPRRSPRFTPRSPPLLPRQPLSLCALRVPAQVPPPLPRLVNRFLPPPMA
jgi:hypothetical protein